MKPGGTEGWEAPFFFGLGLILAALGVFLFLDSVDVTAGGQGVVSGWISGGNGGWHTTSKGVVFMPLLLGVVLLFYNVQWKTGWGLLWVGLAIIMLEILSRIRFQFVMKTSHLVLILGMIAAGVGLMLRGLREDKSGKSDPPTV